MTNTLNTPVEALEISYPLRVERYELRDGSGGAGHHAGGDGAIRALRILNHAARVSVQTDRRIFAVYFDKGKKVQRVADYSLRDGRVVNVSSDATPTMGADNNFLKGLFFNFNPFGGLMQKS